MLEGGEEGDNMPNVSNDATTTTAAAQVDLRSYPADLDAALEPSADLDAALAPSAVATVDGDPSLLRASQLVPVILAHPPLPHGASLLTLKVHNCSRFGVWDAPALLTNYAPNLACLEIVHGWFDTLTDAELVLPPRLVRLRISYCGVREFEPTLPADTLRDLDISFNRIEYLPACLEAVRDRIMLPPGTAAVNARFALNLRNNDFWWQSGTALHYGKITRDSLHELRRANDYGLIGTQVLAHASNYLREKEGRGAGYHLVTKLRTTYDDAQSVHLSSVQTSVRDAVSRIMHAPGLPPYDPAFVDRLADRLRCDECRQGWKRNPFSRRTCGARCQVAVHVVRQDCARAHIHHGALDVSYRDICERLLAFLENAPEAAPVAAEVFGAMREEIVRADKVCLTGKITHLIGTLNGLVPGFAVGISAKESLGDTIVAIRNRWAEAAAGDIDAYITGAVPEALQALEDACISLEEQGAWMDAI